jgi:hypothetical protein
MVIASHNQESIQKLENIEHKNIAVTHLLGFSDNLSN